MPFSGFRLNIGLLIMFFPSLQNSTFQGNNTTGGREGKKKWTFFMCEMMLFFCSSCCLFFRPTWVRFFFLLLACHGCFVKGKIKTENWNACCLQKKQEDDEDAMATKRNHNQHHFILGQLDDWFSWWRLEADQTRCFFSLTQRYSTWLQACCPLQPHLDKTCSAQSNGNR